MYFLISTYVTNYTGIFEINNFIIIEGNDIKVHDKNLLTTIVKEHS